MIETSPASVIHRTNQTCARSLSGISLSLALLAGTAYAQNEPTERPAAQQPSSPSDSGVSPDSSGTELPDDSVNSLRQRIKQLVPRVSEIELDEDTRRNAADLLNRAKGDLDLAADLQQRNAEFKERLNHLAEQAETLKTPPQSEDLPSLSSMDSAALEAQAASLRLRISSQQQTLSTLQQNLDEAADRKRDLQQQVLTLDHSLDEAMAAVRRLRRDSASLPEVVERMAAEAARLRLSEERAIAKTTLAEQDAELSLNLPATRVSRQQKLLAILQQQLTEVQEHQELTRQQESQEQLRLARRSEQDLAAIDNAEVRELVRRRLQFAAENEELTQQKIPYWQKVSDRRRGELRRLKSEARKIRERVERFGTDAALGREVLHFETALPDTDELNNELAAIDEMTTWLRLQQIASIEEHDRITELIQQFGTTASPEEKDVLQSGPEVLNLLDRNNSQLFSLLSDVYGTDRETLTFIDDWTLFAGEHALWLRSHEPLRGSDLRAIPELFTGVALDLKAGARVVGERTDFSVWLLLISAGLAVAILVAVQEKARRGLLKSGEFARKTTCVSMKPTIMALLLSFGMAAEWPLLLMVIGNLAGLGAAQSNAASGTGRALVQLGSIALWLNLFRQILRPGGLAGDHLRWNSVIRNRLRRWLRTVLIAISIPMFLFLLLRNVETPSDVPERVMFITLALCSGGLLIRLLFPVRSDFVQSLTGKSRLLQSTRWLWIALVIAVPPALAICSAAGFHHTATALWNRMGWTVVTASLVILSWSLVIRWLQINHRATRLAMARERAQQRDQQTPEPVIQPAAGASDSDLVVFGAQARSLVRNAAVLVMIGCVWGIWFDVLPALKILDRLELWTIHEQVTETGDSGAETDVTRTEVRSVTVVNLLLAVFTIVAMLIGVRQLPGLVEVILLRQMSFDTGGRYAIATFVRYAVLIAGTIIVCQLLGLRWSQVQWLVAGLSVGLGFGLQEVFANFVSGIIILLERPIRLGDVVTIDGVSGVVSRIQIRSTSITDWDRREYIVPNRELVTGKLLNWTLSDATNRVVIHVGIAYGSDTDRARDLMLQIAHQHPNVLEDPGPIATFEKFGDSALNLVLRAYLPDMNNRLGTITELHTRINVAFAAEGITIPFPQREVHLHGSGPAGGPHLPRGDADAASH